MHPEIVRFIIGLVVGSAVVGSSVSRTLAVHKGDVNGAVLHSIINSASYFYSVYAIVKGDTVGYIGTAVGSTLLMGYMAIKEKNKVK